ncbi:MAG: ATP-binding protein [Gemmataceae bacterium]|nr:ATP-binding protein [Gemmataceae bacterium]
MSDQPIRILLIEDNPGDAELLEVMLGQVAGTPFALECADRLAGGIERLARGGIDLVMLDLTLPDSHGLDTFRKVKARAPSIPIVVMSGISDETIAIKAVHESAQDYLVKGQVTSQLLARGLRYALERKQGELALLRAMEAEQRARRELERAHEELKRTQAQLVQSAKLASLGQLVAGVAHEINNPLAFVANNIVVLERDLASLRDLVRLYQQTDATLAQHQPDTARAIHAAAEAMDLAYTLDNLDGILDRSHDGLKRIQQIVLDLRGFSRASLASDAQHGVDMNDSIASTLNIIRGVARDRDVTLETDFGPLPPGACYPARMNQVVLNLVTNAVEACSAGGKVVVRTRSAPDGALIDVIDNGAGIAPEIRDKIFDPFFTTKQHGEGTGLGLSISHGIVQDHGGRIDVESTPGQGSRFTVFLPAAGGVKGAVADADQTVPS